MVKKIRYFLRYYKILFHLLLGIGFCIISSPLSDLLCYLQKIPDESLFHTIYKIIIPIALFGLWILLLLTNIRDKTYLSNFPCKRKRITRITITTKTK